MTYQIKIIEKNDQYGYNRYWTDVYLNNDTVKVSGDNQLIKLQITFAKKDELKEEYAAIGKFDKTFAATMYQNLQHISLRHDFELFKWIRERAIVDIRSMDYN